ncbi:hypothetical protein R0K17_27790, partial [Planococcus sp. SIMBA_143]
SGRTTASGDCAMGRGRGRLDSPHPQTREEASVAGHWVAPTRLQKKQKPRLAAGLCRVGV